MKGEENAVEAGVIPVCALFDFAMLRSESLDISAQSGMKYSRGVCNPVNRSLLFRCASLRELGFERSVDKKSD
jgi:hypothetical protein